MDIFDWALVIIMAALALFFLGVAVVELRDQWRSR